MNQDNNFNGINNPQPMNNIPPQQPIQQPVQQPIQQPVQQPMNNIPPQQPMQQTIYNNTPNEPKKGGKKGLLIVLAIVIIALIGFGVYYFMNKAGKNKSEEEFDINSSTAFFIQDSNNKYALFNDDGKKLTDFIYTSYNDFVNGYALVKKDDLSGIVDSNGKMTVDFGKYKYINLGGGLFKVTTEDYKTYLINGAGNILFDLEDNDLETYIGEDTFSILEEKKSKTYKVLNYEGKVMASFPISNDDDVEDPSVNQEDNYVSVFYNNKNYIFNPMEGKMIVSFDTDKHYCVNNVEENGKIITMNSCVAWYESQDKTYYKFIKDGKVQDLSDKCDKVYYSDGLLCQKSDGTYLLDDKFNLGISIDGYGYTDSKNYVEPKGTFKGLDFYNNGSLAKHVDCRSLKESGYNKNGIYLLGTYYSQDCGTSSGSYDYYKSNGEKLVDKTFSRAGNFDDNGFAIVSEDKTNYYLLDKNGKKVSEDYEAITKYSGYYTFTKNKQKGLLNKKGEKILDCEYKDITISGSYASLKTLDDNYVIYNLEKQSEVVRMANTPVINKHYIASGNQYYSLKNGKMFYEKK